MAAQTRTKPAQTFSMLRSLRLAVMMLASMTIGGSVAMVIYNLTSAPVL